MIEVLTPTEIAPKCYLFEALYWVAFNRYPIIDTYDENGDDIRFSEEFIYEFDIPLHQGLTPEECNHIGLPADPESIDVYYAKPEQISRILEMDLSREDRQTYEKELVESIEHHKNIDIWREHFNEFIEIYKSKLFVALKEGLISSWGTIVASANAPEETKQLYGQQEELSFNKIPSRSWRLNNIDWEKCSLKKGDLYYYLIHINTGELLQQFPGSEPELATNVLTLAGQYLLDSDQSQKPKRTSNRGRRPSLDWNKVHVEIARRFKIGDLPEKQESFIAEMEAWCFETLNHRPGRSTLLQKISPYYKLKKSEIDKD